MKYIQNGYPIRKVYKIDDWLVIIMNSKKEKDTRYSSS